MYIRPDYTTKYLYIIKNQISSNLGENLVDTMTIQPPQELIGSPVSLFFQNETGTFQFETELISNYQDGQLEYNIPSLISNYSTIKYKIKSSSVWETEFGFIYFKKQLAQGGEL